MRALKQYQEYKVQLTLLIIKSLYY